MLGKLNFFLGAGAPNGRPVLYPDIDFCSGNICSKVDANPTLVWDIGLFEWTERIQVCAASLILLGKQYSATCISAQHFLGLQRRLL